MGLLMSAEAGSESVDSRSRAPSSSSRQQRGGGDDDADHQERHGHHNEADQRPPPTVVAGAQNAVVRLRLVVLGRSAATLHARRGRRRWRWTRWQRAGAPRAGRRRRGVAVRHRGRPSGRQRRWGTLRGRAGRDRERVVVSVAARPAGAHALTASASAPSRARLRSRPSSSIDSNSGGETRRPVTATRTGPKAWRGLRPRLVDQRGSQRRLDRGGDPSPGSAASASCAAPSDLAAVVVERLDGVGRVDREVRLVDEQEAEHVDDLGELVDPLGDQRHRGVQHALLLGSRWVGDEAGGGEVRDRAAADLLDRQQPHVRGVDRLGLLEVEAGRVGVDVADVEGGVHLLEGEHVVVGRDRPAQQGEVVEQALGQEAALAVQEQVGLRVALGELLVALAHHVGQVAELVASNFAMPSSISAS